MTEERPGQHRLAWALNMLINPLTAAPVLMGFVVAHAGAGPDTLVNVVVAACVGYLLLPLALLVSLKKQGLIGSIEARDQKQRSKALRQGTALLVVAGFLCWLVAGEVQRSVTIVAMVLVIHLILARFITPRIKVSLHVAAVAGMVSMLLMLEWLSGNAMPFAPWIHIILLVLIPIMMWARMADGAHSRNEVIAGLFFGLLLPPVLLWMLDAAWLL